MRSIATRSSPADTERNCTTLQHHCPVARASSSAVRGRCWSANSGPRLAGFILLTAILLRADEPFFANGKTTWQICLSPEADPTEIYAAEELRTTLKKVSGADFAVITSSTARGSATIILGTLDHPEVRSHGAALQLSPGKNEEVAVYALKGRLYLAGNQPRAVLYAVYSFLQRELGVRWLWPGPSGEFIPAKANWTLPTLAFNHRPAFTYRGFHLCGAWRDHQIFRQWMARNFINIHRHAAKAEEKRLGFHSMWSSHNVRLKDRTVFQQHPEYFAEVSGTRYRENICFSNREVDELVAGDLARYTHERPQLDILSIFPTDNQTYCRCPQCGEMDVSTAWFEFYNRLSDALKARFPELKLATIAYQGYRDVPNCRIRNSEFVEYASYMRCNTHPFGHPNCQRNQDITTAWQAWKATGLAIGNYAYEYDIFRKNSRFVPFLSLIDDAVKTGRELGHVAMITEVPLSPKLGPDLCVVNVQNRLSIYLYARLLWDSDEAMLDILRDWCRTAFGPAAEPMVDYYVHMDRAWTEMPVHTGILGDAMNVAQSLFVNELPAKVAADFSAADRALSGMAGDAGRARAATAIEREKALFKQWHDLNHMTNTETPRLNLPLLARPADFPQSACRPRELAGPTPVADGCSTQVRLAWTRVALLVNWICRDPRIGSLRSLAASRDDNVVGDDSVELVLAKGITGETWHFALNPNGIVQDYRHSAVGVREDLWNADWDGSARIGVDRWEAEMTIPFASLGRQPTPDETWQVRFLRHDAGRQDLTRAAFPAKGMAVLFFNAVARTDRALFWWSGAPEREGKRDAGLIQDFTRIGWQIDLVTARENLLARKGTHAAFWFRHPNGPNKVPSDYWQKRLVPAVKNGALAVFASYWDIPLEEYFGDPSFAVDSVTTGKTPLAGRRSQFIAPGDWSMKPNDLLPRLKRRITPAYGFVPENAAAWAVLATAPRAGGSGPFPYILARPYGKGMIILCGDAIPIPAAKMLENFVAYHESHMAAADD